jgi:hypothetical protein
MTDKDRPALAVAPDAECYRSIAEALSRDALATTSHNREALGSLIGALRAKADQPKRTR